MKCRELTRDCLPGNALRCIGFLGPMPAFELELTMRPMGLRSSEQPICREHKSYDFLRQGTSLTKNKGGFLSDILLGNSFAV
jgi:hypothetical protein